MQSPQVLTLLFSHPKKVLFILKSWFPCLQVGMIECRLGSCYSPWMGSLKEMGWGVLVVGLNAFCYQQHSERWLHLRVKC